MGIYFKVITAATVAALVHMVVPTAARAGISGDAARVLESCLQVVGGIYSVLTGFVIFVVWEQFNALQKLTVREGSLASEVPRLAALVGGENPEIRRKVTAATRVYLDAVGLGGIVQVEARVAPFCLFDRPYTEDIGDFCVAERLVAGVAAGDLDTDGDVDLVFAPIDGGTRVMLNDGRGGFADATAAAGIDSSLRTVASAIGDLDRDGDLDVYLTSFGGLRHLLYINDGRGVFSEEALVRGAAGLSPRDIESTRANASSRALHPARDRLRTSGVFIQMMSRSTAGLATLSLVAGCFSPQ
jgi:FG-GAP-like repeat